MIRTVYPISLRANALLAASLAGTTLGCAATRHAAPPLEPEPLATTPAPATTRAIAVEPPSPPAATVPTTPATAPTDHHAAPPRRTGP
jgi:hypothetical protein